MTTFTLLWVQCVLLLSLLVVVSDDSQRAYTLELVQVVHRHGSRSPLVTYNETKLCGLEFPCGYLNRQGQDMLVNTGRFLRTRYTTDDTVVDPSSPFLTQESYNLTVSYTRSTDVLRTLQSADALLRGLFPNMAAYYPAVHTVDPLTDGFLKSEGVPAVRVAYKYGIQEEHDVCWPVVDQNFTLAVLQSIAAEVHSQEWCSTAQRRMECARSLCDIGLAYQTTDTLSGYPLLKEYLTSLCRASICRNRHYASYNSTNPVQKQQGSYAQPLLQELVNKVNQTRDGSNTFKIIHYSTHESTLHPMVSALGDNSDLAMMPPFATTYVFELLRRATAAEGSTEVGDYAMRVKRGHPGVTPDTNFEFAWDDFELAVHACCR
ncbi:membrane-bound acid phosphatase precursor [Angomonas deanei]|uniref:Histidine phosphatase superfamily (Branch 2), putative n=1 Tax=Angomonas deanei TaxID=59799 RepID=A0A7G2C3Y0_9TRYP|nr:membrane-bound acid phosphatase precursor [Angomonas deanei]CAD2214400.1 Histidine phosphatase superfamily (branch 2), putative [Angomonas deanei]|eukprot:EPY43177.1 membrane-bound acid phosphatase precursor [Angomonas deanei]